MVKQKCSRVLSVFIALFLIFSIVSPVSVFAASVSTESGDGVGVTTYNIKMDEVLKSLAKKVGTSGKIGLDGSNLNVTTKGVTYTLLTIGNSTVGTDGTTKGFEVYPTSFKNAKKSDVNKAMRYFVDAVTEAGGNPDDVQQLMSDIQDTDSSVSSVMLPLIFESTKGDMYQAYKITSPFLEILSIVLGVGAVLLILLLLFSTVMDLAYIGLPVWREAQASKDGGNKNPFGVSYEALTTVKEVEKGLGGGDGGYRNAYLLYFKRRALTYIILAICIFYLICGGLSGIIGFVLNLVSGITG